MNSSRQLGLEELMIVNPGQPREEPFLGEDGTLYQVQGLGGENEPQGLGQFFLGEDGTLYQVHDLGGENELLGMGQFFLGEDGTLLQVQGSDPDSLSEPAESFDEDLGESNGHELGRYFLGADGALYEVIR